MYENVWSIKMEKYVTLKNYELLMIVLFIVSLVTFNLLGMAVSGLLLYKKDKVYPIIKSNLKD